MEFMKSVISGFLQLNKTYHICLLLLAPWPDLVATASWGQLVSQSFILLGVSLSITLSLLGNDFRRDGCDLAAAATADC